MKNAAIFRYFTATALLSLLVLILLNAGCKRELAEQETETPVDLETYHAEIDRLIALEGFDTLGTGLQMMDPQAYARLPLADINQLPRLTAGVEDRAGRVQLNTPSVRNQGSEGSCVAFSAGYAAVSYYLKAIRGWSYTTNGALRSPEFLYNTAKLAGDCNAGTNFSTALNFLAQYGICAWSDMPYYDWNGCSQWPNSVQWQYAYYSRISSWSQISRDPGNLRNLLNLGYPIIAGIQLDDSFYGQTASYPYIWKSSYGASRGGHAVLIIGYDDSKQAFIVQNSWGTGKHDRGYFYISYNLVSQIGNNKLQLFLINGLKSQLGPIQSD